MPNNGPLSGTPCQIVTNLEQIENPSYEFILSGQYYADGINENGGKQVAIKIPPKNLAVAVSHSIKEAFMSGLSQSSVIYLSRDEVQGDTKTTEVLSDEYRILRIMPVLTIQQADKEFLHLTLRGHGASDAGHWGCASSLVARAITPRSIYGTLNRETGLLIDGNIATFAPNVETSLGDIAAIYKSAQGIKNSLIGKSRELKMAFARMAPFVEIPVQQDLPENADTVSFYGALKGDFKCVAIDNPHQRTLTLAVPVVARVQNTAVLTAFNGEGYNGPSALVDKEFLKKEGTKSGIKLIPGLHEMILGS